MGPVKAGPEGRERVYLGLGSNVGDREANLRHGLELVGEWVVLERASHLYDTQPWGYDDQPRFLNCACVGWTSLGPRALLTALKDVERTVGRVPSFPNGPRVLDVDILYYGQQVISEPGLEIPHPRLPERTFVLVPLGEIASAFQHPVLKLTASELLGKLEGSRSAHPEAAEGVNLWGAPTPVPRPSG